jgi:hypothetical protein
MARELERIGFTELQENDLYDVNGGCCFKKKTPDPAPATPATPNTNTRVCSLFSIIFRW